VKNDTAMGKVAVRSCSYNLKNVLLFFRFFSIPSAFLYLVLFDTQQSLCRTPEKKILDKELFADKMFANYFLLSVTIGKGLDTR
jgi:hypothetical protein